MCEAAEERSLPISLRVTGGSSHPDTAARSSDGGDDEDDDEDDDDEEDGDDDGGDEHVDDYDHYEDGDRWFFTSGYYRAEFRWW